MARARTTKTLAQRIDLNYFKRATPLKRAKLWLSILFPALALVWILWHGLAGDSRVYSSGRMSAAHAVLEAECAACHVQAAGAFSAKASDTACLSCHDGPLHHATTAQRAAVSCAECHTEHRGRVNLRAASDQSCSRCHGDLAPVSVRTRFANHIESLEHGHPEFAALRDGARDPGTIKVNHAIHMKPIRRDPNGSNVQLECGDCHRPAAAEPALTYSDAKYRAAAVSYSESEEVRPFAADALRSSRGVTGRELMAPVKFANACAGCHSLAFDKRFGEGVPHDSPEVVHAFLVKKFSEYIGAYPEALREARDPGRDLTGKPVQAATRIYTAKEWVAVRVAEAEELLWRKTCKQCHDIGFANEGSQLRIREATHARARLDASTLPTVAAAETTLLWMPHARFDHDAHRGFSCVSCHEKAVSSTEASDVLLPGIATCRKCHAPGPGHAESRCFECHTYHDWSKRKEVKPTFTLPALRSGGK